MTGPKGTNSPDIVIVVRHCNCMGQAELELNFYIFWINDLGGTAGKK